MMTARNMTPTHRVTVAGKTYDVMLTEEGVAYDEDEWNSESAADIEVDARGRWLFQGKPGIVQKVEKID